MAAAELEIYWAAEIYTVPAEPIILSMLSVSVTVMAVCVIERSLAWGTSTGTQPTECHL